MSTMVVVGGGVGGLTAAALLGSAGHTVTLLESGPALGGKSHRIELNGQRVDTGPSLFTFPAVWEELLRRMDTSKACGPGGAKDIADLGLDRLPEVGRYYYRDQACPLPVPAGHPWHGAWERFADLHGSLGPDITTLLTTGPLARTSYPSLARLSTLYGRHLTTRSYLDSLTWLPDGLREIIAIHTLNAGVGPSRTPALYASMPAVMAHDGVWVPQGGIYELVLALERLAHAGNVTLRTNEPVLSVEAGKVRTAENVYPADVVLSGVDEQRLESLLGHHSTARPRTRSCSAIALYATLNRSLPAKTAGHSVVLPDDPAALYTSLRSQEEPAQTMAFVNYYPQRHSNANSADTLGLLLTSPANGRSYDLDSTFVKAELSRITRAMGLPAPFEDYLQDYRILDPNYFSAAGSSGGALYGRVRPLWMSGPFHRPASHSLRRPWLWRVGASVHPGGGLPAVMGGAMMAVERLLRSVGPAGSR